MNLRNRYCVKRGKLLRLFIPSFRCSFNSRARLCWLLLACSLFMTACGWSYKDEGAIDYRKAEILVKDGKAILEPTAFTNKPSQPRNEQPRNEQHELIRVARLDRKNVLHDSSETKFSDDDAICIRLISAYIEEYSEGPLSIVGDAFFKGQFRPRGEIAVVVNAFKITDEKSFDFSDDSINEGKIVFYSDDVVEGQFLNFNNMPIYGPYSVDKMRGMGLEIWIMELDIQDALTGKLLETIAAQRGKGVLTALPGHTILESLGSTLINSVNTDNSNDTDFLYRVLLERKENAILPYPALEVGHYVFIRAPRGNEISGMPLELPAIEDIKDIRNILETKDINWANLRLDENTGRLYKAECEDNNNDVGKGAKDSQENNNNNVSGKNAKDSQENNNNNVSGKSAKGSQENNNNNVSGKSAKGSQENNNNNKPGNGAKDSQKGSKKGDSKCKYREFTDYNYLVIKIDKGSGDNLSIVNKAYGDFTRALKASELKRSRKIIDRVNLNARLSDLKEKFRKYRKDHKDKAVDNKADLVASFKLLWADIQPSIMQHRSPNNQAAVEPPDFTRRELEEVAIELERQMVKTCTPNGDTTSSGNSSPYDWFPSTQETRTETEIIDAIKNIETKIVKHINACMPVSSKPSSISTNSSQTGS